MKRLCLLALLVLLVVALPLAGCQPRLTPEAPQANAPAASTEPVVLTCAGEDWGYPSPFGFYPRGPGYLRMSFLFDTLTWKDENGVVAWLATAWDVSEDATVWTFTLRDDVSFHDGEPLTAEDVAFTYDYFVKHIAAFKWNAGLEKITSVEALDDQRVQISLDVPSAAFLVDTAGSVPIIPKHIWEGVEDPGRFVAPEAVIGSGPFVLGDYSREEGRYVYDANGDHFMGAPNVDRVVFVKVQDEALALETGTIDVASFWGKEIAAVEKLEDRFASIEGPSFWVLQVILNTSREPLSDVRLRRAIAHAVDRAKLVEQVTHGGAIVANLGIVSPNTEWAHPDLPGYAYDPDAARALLSEAGHTGLALCLITTANFGREAELVKADLEAAGMQVEVVTGDRATVDGLLREGDFDLALNGHGGIANPNILRTPSWPSEVYQNPAYDELFRQQAQTVDEAARREQVYRLQEIIAEDLPVLTLYHPLMWCLYDPEVLDTWFYTQGGISIGIPIELNKIVFFR